MKTTAKKFIISSSILSISILLGLKTLAAVDLGQKLSGRILLQIEDKGQAWYINTNDFKRYFLGRPQDAFNLMRTLGIGITNENLNKIPIAIVSSGGIDSDSDGLEDTLENAIGTDLKKSDTDNDGYSDILEINNNHNPINNKQSIDLLFAQKYKGKIFLQVENSGQAWYINPLDARRYFLGRPLDAFNLMRKLGLGITNENLNKIISASNPIEEPIATSTSIETNAEEVKKDAALAINKNETTKFLTYFTPQLKTQMEYGLKYLTAEGKENLSYILANATLSSETEQEKIFVTDVYFALGGYNKKLYFTISKQPDNQWLISKM